MSSSFLTADREGQLRSQLEAFPGTRALAVGHNDSVIFEPGWTACRSLGPDASYWLDRPDGELVRVSSANGCTAEG